MRKVLIVEDEQIQRESLINNALEVNPNIVIKSTDSYKKAFEIAINNKIEVFFIDIQLIDGSGIELAKRLRNTKGYKFTPIIFITGIPTKEMEAFHDIHCYDYIIKPFSKSTLKKVMKSILIDYFETTSKENDNYLLIDFKGIKQRVNMSEIYFIEHRQRKIVIVTKYEEIVYKHISMKKFIIELDDRFVQVHQSFIINKDLVDKVDVMNRYISLNNISELVPIGTSYKINMGEFFNADT